MIFLLEVIRIGSITISLGAFLAILCSWSRNQSIVWAIIHACLGWLYVIYFAMTR